MKTFPWVFFIVVFCAITCATAFAGVMCVIFSFFFEAHFARWWINLGMFIGGCLAVSASLKMFWLIGRIWNDK